MLSQDKFSFTTPNIQVSLNLQNIQTVWVCVLCLFQVELSSSLFFNFVTFFFHMLFFSSSHFGFSRHENNNHKCHGLNLINNGEDTKQLV